MHGPTGIFWANPTPCSPRAGSKNALVRLLTWLRYSLFTVLYPTGVRPGEESTLLYVLSHTTPHTNLHINKTTDA